MEPTQNSLMLQEHNATDRREESYLRHKKMIRNSYHECQNKKSCSLVTAHRSQSLVRGKGKIHRTTNTIFFFTHCTVYCIKAALTIYFLMSEVLGMIFFGSLAPVLVKFLSFTAAPIIHAPRPPALPPGEIGELGIFYLKTPKMI